MCMGKILTGLLCCLLEKHNFKSFDDHYRVPIYTLFGSSLAFVIVYAIFDVVEIVKRLWHEVIMR